MTTDWTRRALALADAAVQASRTGEALFYADLSVALARDDLIASAHDVRVAGWIVERNHDGHDVIFVDDGDPPHAVWSTTFTASGTPMGRRIARGQGRLSPVQAALARARRLVQDQLEVAHDTIIVPAIPLGAPVGPIAVYIIAESGPGDMFLGLHRRVDVSADGAAILSVTPLSRSASVVPGLAGHPPQDVVTTLLDGTVPDAIHVYLSLRHGVPIEVLTVVSGLHWRVDANRIVALGRLPSA